MKKLVPVLIIFFALNGFSQKEANFWYFGENAGLDFTSNPPDILNSSLSTDEGSASISNSEGILQFYTDGSTVFNSTGAIMDNGTGLLGDSSSAQSAIIVPKPLNSNIYYVFTVGRQQNRNLGNGVAYSTVDMTLNSGLGGVTSKNIFLNGSSNAREKITSVRGDACNTFWVITSDINNFYAYLITDSGVINNAQKSLHNNNLTNLRGYLKISPDGKTLVNASANSGTYIFDFNASNGEITNGGSLSSLSYDGYGVEFSRDGQKLYISTGTFSQFNNNSGVRNPPDYASISQFNLESRNITDINTSIKLIYDTNSGYRGALQLASNGKIYYARSRTSFLGVINSPEKDASEVNFIEDGLNLGGKISTEGLPPFIQSFFLEIEIKDLATNIVLNSQDLKFCTGQDKVISPEPITGTDINYLWTFDNGTTITETISSSATQKNLELDNINYNDKGTYKLKITLKDRCKNDVIYNATFNIEVFEASVATRPSDVFFCDTDRDGFNNFDLQADISNEILNGLDPAIFEVLYFSNDVDAISGDNPLPNPYTNPTAFSSQTIFARVQNKNATDACFDIIDFVLAVTDLPVPVQPTPLRICDDLVSGDDTDGIVDTFILIDKDDDIYGSLDQTQYTISYHTTQTGAEINDVATIIDKNVGHPVTNTQTVYIRVENKDNINCYDADKTLELIVDALPVTNLNPTLNQCIEGTDTATTVNLTIAEINISNNYENEDFEYYLDPDGLDLITNPTSYPVQVNIPQSVFVKVRNNFSGCSGDLVELKINVGRIVNNDFNDVQTPECDDLFDADGNITDDTDNVKNFTLNKEQIVINIKENISNSENTTVFFYENEQDRTNSLNAIDISNYKNDIDKIEITTISGGIQFPIYYKILSDVNNNCQGLGEFYLQINSIPLISSEILSPIKECDTDDIDGNYSNGSIPNINLTEKIDELFQGTGQAQNDFTFSFYKSEAAAFSGDITNTDYILNPNDFTNDIPLGFLEGDVAKQTIYIRVENANGCINTHASFDIIINPLPIITNIIPNLEICDIGTKDGNIRNGLAQNVNISVRDIDFLGNKNASDFTVTYHKTLINLKNLNSTGVDKNNYDSDRDRVNINLTTNVSEEVLYVRILNNNTGCIFDLSELTIIINPEPVFEVPTNLPYCDNNNDDDDANGIVQNIDLDSKIPEILGSTQNSNDFIVTFHLSQTDATTGDNAIESPYENTNPTETIYVRIQQKQTLCVNDDATFDVIINSLPDFTVTTPQILCLIDAPLNIAVENPRDVYSYEWKDERGATIGTDSNINVFSGGTYRVTATTTNGTFCEREETIVINESDPAILERSFVTIIDEGNNLGSTNNLSISIDTISNNIGIGDYQFAVLNTDNNERFPFIGFQEEPLFENLEGGIYQIIVNDKNGCVPDTMLLVSVIQFPKFFTPNGDGDNDFWVVKGANQTFYPNASINVFNRFGKLVAQVPIDSEGWNGIYQGKLLPSDDYWYNITLIPADTTKPSITKKGNFSLLRK
ncbi:T9SS type B sorting domain-containing protein [Polaribacter sp. IC066]|uniref:T9SS type B sorting domain-containing protein n=2 Tax=unclassified Polaribacter TaxID=196858 RepID=UPI0011BD6CFC|nr:T9SS type B sorting domain-containing protein [Polaribacter sp. IC066]TXD61817.1 T9SS type B sorting domain-containing protein [Polaribacter sp. IC066]